MESFGRIGGRLHCEQVPLEDIARRFGTPAYVYSTASLLGQVDLLEGALGRYGALVCFSVKSNPSGAILRLLGERGLGADIVSGGELFRALRAGISPERIVYAGVGKTAVEIEAALAAGVLMLNVESLPELDLVEEVAKRMGVTAPIGIRVNPDVDANTHAKTTTGKKENKFGIALEQVVETFAAAASRPHLNPIGIGVHLGSPIFSLDPYQLALEKLLGFVDEVAGRGIGLRILDMGGGFGITYRDEAPFTPMQFAQLVERALSGRDLRLIIEPGRFIVGNSAALLTRITYVKDTPGKSFYICDAGMNDLIRPAFYGSYHRIEAVDQTAPGERVVDVVGPICESSDVFATQRSLPALKAGQLVAIMGAGAYGFSMACNYNSRPLACEVLVDGGTAREIRKRQTYEDLVAGETL